MISLRMLYQKILCIEYKDIHLAMEISLVAIWLIFFILFKLPSQEKYVMH